MKRIHFDSKGPVRFHYFFWQPWGCLGCLGRVLLFLVLLFIFFFLLSQFRSCSEQRGGDDGYEPVETPIDSLLPDEADNVIPPINDDDVIDDNGRQIVSNRLNVLFEAQVGEQLMMQWIEKFKSLYPGDEYKVLFYDVNTKLLAIEVPADRRRELLTALPQQIPDIPFMVFEESVMNPGYRPADTAFGNPDTTPWYFEPIKAYEAWDISKGSQDVIVAVVDSYFDLGNPEFARSSIVQPYSVVNGSSDVSVPSSFDTSNPSPVLSHGTMVAAVAIGGMDNSHGSAGIAPECSFMPVSLGDRFGCLAMLQGLLYAVNHSAQVVNISAGLAFSDQLSSLTVEQQIELARNELLAQEDVWKYVFDMCEKFKVTVVWAAGNENLFTALDASKRGENTIKVSAVDRNMSKADFSNFGNFADRNIYESTISAPGVGIYGEIPLSGAGAAVDGTSFSAPLVAGAVGLMKSIDPTHSTPEIASILQRTGRETTSTIGPVMQIAPALMAVYDGLLPFADLKALYNSSGSVNKTLPTTLLRPMIHMEGEDTTALADLIQIKFRFTSPRAGKVLYYSNLTPEQPWEADFNMSYDSSSGSFVIKQPSDAQSPQSPQQPFAEAVFTVVQGQFGKAYIEKYESRSNPRGYKAFIKKEGNGEQ